MGSYTSPYLYHVNVTGLTPGTQYYYQVGDSTSGLSDIFSFTAHPGVGADIPHTFAIVGDLGQTANSQSTVQHIMDRKPAVDSVMHVGDLSYADSDEPRWDSWGQLVQPLAATTPYMVQVCVDNNIAQGARVPPLFPHPPPPAPPPYTIYHPHRSGNHEQETSPFVAYAARFWMPPPAHGPKAVWYSFNVAAAHWVTLSNYHDFSSGSPQNTWLKADLAAIDRTQTPWVFVNTHAPWYNTNSAHQGDGEAQRKALEKMLYDAGVDAVFTGHVHAYERNHRAYNNNRDSKGPVYITIGDGGNREGLATKWLAQTPVSAFRMATYGHGELQVVNATAAHWTWHTNPDAESKTEDELWIIKGQDC
jgi:hypothetical protein